MEQLNQGINMLAWTIHLGQSMCAGSVKINKTKVGNRGDIVMFVEHPDGHAGDTHEF